MLINCVIIADPLIITGNGAEPMKVPSLDQKNRDVVVTIITDPAKSKKQGNLTQGREQERKRKTNKIGHGRIDKEAESSITGRSEL